MGILGEILKHPDELIPLLKLKMSLEKKKTPRDSQWDFCYSMLRNFSTGFTIAVQQLDTELRNAACIFYLVLRALDTIEDDTSIPDDIKVPILVDFHKHIYDPNWHFSCGSNDYKLLMDQFHHVSTIFCRLEKGYQEVIEDVTKLVGVAMAKFIDKEIESMDDCDEYCCNTAGYIAVGLSKIFHTSGLEDQVPSHLCNSVGMFVQKTNIIRDYLEDINEIPKPRMFWPREIWSKYVNKLEDLKYEENSDKAVQCLNDMVANALIHTEDCMRLMSSLRDRAIFRFWVIPQLVAIGTLALCYNNVHVFKGVIKIRRGLIAKIVDGTNTMADVYGAFFDFSCIMKAKIDKNDPNASITLRRIEGIQKICRDSGSLSKRKLYILRSEPRHIPIIVSISMACEIRYLPLFSNEYYVNLGKSGLGRLRAEL